MIEARFVVLSFRVEGSGDRITKRASTEADSLSAAMLTGAHLLKSCDGVIIVERIEGRFNVVGKVGAAENPTIALYALAELTFNIWPLPSLDDGMPTRAVLSK